MSHNPVLRFTPYAWAKLLHLRDLGDTEIGAFGISHDPDDLFTINDLGMVKQQCSVAKVDFDDEGIADFTDEQVDLGRHPTQFLRVWIHTHPGDSPHPSGTDETTFRDCFGRSDWSIMFIIAKGGKTYCRLQFSTARKVFQQEIAVYVNWKAPFPASNAEAWKAEYDKYVTKRGYQQYSGNSHRTAPSYLDVGDDYPLGGGRGSTGGYTPGAYKESGFGSHAQGGRGQQPAGFHSSGAAATANTAGSTRNGGSKGNESAATGSGTTRGGSNGSNAGSGANRTTPWSDADESWRTRFRRSRELDPGPLPDRRQAHHNSIFFESASEAGGGAGTGTVVVAEPVTERVPLEMDFDSEHGDEDTIVVDDPKVIVVPNEELDALALKAAEEALPFAE